MISIMTQPNVSSLRSPHPPQARHMSLHQEHRAILPTVEPYFMAPGPIPPETDDHLGEDSDSSVAAHSYTRVRLLTKPKAAPENS